MRILSQIVLLLALTGSIFAQSPHGSDFDMSCTDCHNSKSWKLEAGTYTFDHGKTSFPLTGMHQDAACVGCHPTLKFKEAGSECISCHTDMHQETLGTNCAECHTPKSWIVDNITEIHQRSRFPLLGPHATADCYQCHPSASTLVFEPLGIECYDCHKADYNATTDPNHTESGFSTDCIECHRVDGTTWTGTNINHSFFPLVEGHAINDCAQCHTNNDYSNTPTDCFACHEVDYMASINPNHAAAELSTDCSECHTTSPDWKPADFTIHDAQYFPIYSGGHKDEWNNCSECHTVGNNYNVFSCIDCHDHNKPDSDDEHDEVNGYIYESIACFECHPTGDAENTFNHAATNFPLTGAHLNTDCIECHEGGYEGTTMYCYDCHIQEYEQSTNPNHMEVGIANDCAECHTTDPEWTPAQFPMHDEIYPLTGEHLSATCFDCHEGVYANTPNECVSCHQINYEQTTNPNHISIGISNDCAQCHTTDADWQPAQFPVHDEYYVLEGAHVTIAADCFECHQGNYTTTPNTCFGCHADEYNQSTDPNHIAAQFPTECETCHSQTAWEPANFNHDAQYFPIYSGSHEGEWEECMDCHNDPGNYAIFQCLTCHPQPEMNEEHQGFPGYVYNSIACLECHPDGSSASGFDHSATGFILDGGHAGVDCFACHEGNYGNTPNTCVSCHLDNFNQTTDPNHVESGFPQECEICHTTQPGWSPATFNGHDEIWPLTGAHTTASCIDCHESGYTNTSNECASCHIDAYNQTTDPNHVESGFPTECEVCHTTNPGWTPANYSGHDEIWPLTGAHTSATCFDCHQGSYTNTPNECAGCHIENFNQTSNPDHNELGLTNNCALCHTTDPDWQPATFPVHDEYYVLEGAHVAIANNCFECHEGNYTTTPNTCYGCHQEDYTSTNDPNHQAAQFPTDCEMCHNQNAWEPSTFNHDNQYFPIYSGEHEGEWDQCSDCHSDPTNYAIFQCLTCHPQGEMDDEHEGIPGYVYNSINCLECHPDGGNATGFDHGLTNFPLDGAHSTVDCFDCHQGSYENTPSECVACHIENFNQTTDPNHVQAGFPQECNICHTTDPGWTPASFSTHDEIWPLTGAHETISCNECHQGNYTTISNECASCHINNYNQTTDPDHGEIGFATTCEECHTTNPGWSPATFAEHDNFFPLNGAHTTISCYECHEGSYTNTPNECVGCHLDNYNQTNDPNHVESGFPQECEICHTTSPGWSPASYNGHDEIWPLTGAHETTSCNECHQGNYTTIPNECASCHISNYNQTTDPDHGEIGFATTCEECHTTNPGWSPATYADHDNFFPLNGAHTTISCYDCHEGSYTNTPNECAGCHIDNYNQTTDPNHIESGFPQECEICHTTSPGWSPATFNNHDDIWPLTGAHETISCNECHQGNYTNMSNECQSCHIENYNQTTNPDHSGNGFSTNCDECHTTNPGWSPANYANHENVFPLTGAHASISCNDCHEGGYGNTPNECSGCHIENYNQTTDPNHIESGYPTECQVCHTTNPGWSPASYSGHDEFYPLTGAHETVSCFDCHEGNYTNTPNECAGCHIENYNATSNPDHNDLGLTNDCAQCHTTNPNWQPATFPVHDDFYQLQGAHASIANDCFECHEGSYSNTPNTCFGCHEGDYNSTNDPNHQLAQFPTDCEPCHSQTAWTPSTFNHDSQYFPIYSGKHQGEWDQCIDCHTTPGNFTIFDCINCHSNAHHQSQGNAGCYSCHPNGNGKSPVNMQIERTR